MRDKVFSVLFYFSLRLENRDRDGDVILNWDDDCPDTPGLPILNGCLNTNWDCIKDAEDKFANMAGTDEDKRYPKEIVKIEEAKLRQI